jgi:ribosomal protein S12 methylthiotransferase
MQHRTPSVAFVTLGCPKNEVDSDRMRASIEGSAFRFVDDPADADVVVVNTCSFIQEATEESIETVMDLVHERAGEREGRKIVVAGCMPSRYGRELETSMPEVDAFLPVADEARLLDLLEGLTGAARGVAVHSSVSRTTPGPSAYLTVSDGCHRSCAFCTIPSIRGDYRSRSLDEIVAEARALADGGARELILIGQDTTSWGRDLDGPEKLADLLRAISQAVPDTWIRLMYAQPDGLTDRLIREMAALPNVCHYLDMPLQHASESVLRAMRRNGSAGASLELIEKIRSAMPDVALRTTLIAGFPGERTRDVREVIDFIEAASFDYVGVFVYSPEAGTPAAAAPDQVPLRTRRARAQRIRDAADAVGFDRSAEHVGSMLDVLVEGFDEDEGLVVGRWCGQAPEIDGVVLLDRGTAGTIVRAEIEDSFGYDLLGKVL